MIYSTWVPVLIICLMTGFFWLGFEKSKPAAWELVLLSQLCALSIALRAVFSFVPYFNPVLAVIFLTGTALGGQKGFVAGSVSALISNFIFGQGPWTFYQMLGWGLCGGCSGILVKAGVLRSSGWKFSDYAVSSAASALLIVFVTGPVMDLSSFFMMGELNFKMLKVILAGGFVMNVILAASTVFSLCIMARTFLFSVERACRKSGNFTQNS